MSFELDTKIAWYRSPIDPDVLQSLMQRKDAYGWRQVILHLGLFFATGGLAYYAYLNLASGITPWSIAVLGVALFAHGTMGPFMGLVAIHELQHRTVFRSRDLNSFFERVYAFISWSDYIWYEKSHPQHHQATCHTKYDGEVQLPIRFSTRRWSFWVNLLLWNPLITWQRLRLTWRHANGDVRGDWYQYVLPESDIELRRRHRNWARTLLIGHGLLATIFIASGHWFLVVVFTIGTQYCSWLGFLCGVPQHFGLNSNLADFRMSTRTFTCSWLPAFYYWNMQYHLEHHMFPAVPFYNLPKLRAAIADDLPPAPHGLRATWREIMQIRARSKADPHYRFLPQIPKREMML